MLAELIVLPFVRSYPHVSCHNSRRMFSHRSLLQLKAVLWKNVLLTRRNKRDFFREFGSPFLMLAVLSAISFAAYTRSRDAVPDYPAQTVLPLAFVMDPSQAVWVAPCTGKSALGIFAGSVMANLYDRGLNVTCFECETASACGAASMLTSYANTPYAALGAVVFDSIDPVSYRLRLDSSKYAPGVGTSNATSGYLPDGTPSPPDTSQQAYASTLMPLQMAVDAAIAAVTLQAAGRPTPPPYTVLTKQFPSPSFFVDVSGAALVAIVPIYMTLIFTLQVRVLLTRILEEKEKRIKILLRMNGLSPITDLAAWTITALVKNTVMVTIVVAVACNVGIFKYSAFTVVLVFFLLFMATCIAFCFLMATLFSKSRTGGAVGMLVYMLLSAPTYALTIPGVPYALKIALGLLSPCAFSLGTSIIVLAEQKHAGITWGNAFNPAASNVNVSLGALGGMLVIDLLLYLGLGFYLDAVVPTEFGCVFLLFMCVWYICCSALPL